MSRNPGCGGAPRCAHHPSTCSLSDPDTPTLGSGLAVFCKEESVARTHSLVLWPPALSGGWGWGQKAQCVIRAWTP